MSAAPPPTILYRLFDAGGTLLYVGITGSIGQRWEQHVASKHWWDEVTRTEIERFPDRDAAATAEKAAIENEHPRHNFVSRPRVKSPQTGINYAYSAGEHRAWKAAAALKGQSFKEWIRRALNEAAAENQEKKAAS